MIKRAIGIAMAFIGVIVGAGFASGQEAMQYFVAFGNEGLWGVAVAAALMMIAGIAMLQLGSYFQAEEHTAVYGKVSGPFISRILDWSTLLTLFSIGFVMFAGGGANLEQQFGISTWIGGTIMLVLVLLTGLLDVDRVTTVIGLITPFIIVFIVAATVITIVQSDVQLSTAHDFAVNNVDTTLPNWWVSALNYTGLNAMCAVSMSIVIGGNFLDSRAVGWGGLMGGFVYLLLLALLVVSLYFVAPEVNGSDLPVLMLINEISPALSYVMTIIVFGMIFNTAVGMFYAMAKRLTRDKRENFYKVYATACIIGFILSFVGFKALVGWVYPILGYLGLLMIAVMAWGWLSNRSKLTEEADRRERATVLVQRKLDPRERFTKKNQRELRRLAKASNMKTEDFINAIAEEIHDELEQDDELEDYDRNEPEPSVVYVQHTKPE